MSINLKKFKIVCQCNNRNKSKLYFKQVGEINYMNYHNITHNDMLNGEGLRVVLWVAGCSHHCKNCQNPETWDPDGGIKFDDKAFNEILNELDHEYISGLTLSGGDPLYSNNIEEVTRICRIIKDHYPDKNIWLYTGYIYETLYSLDLEILKYIDVLVDGEFVESLKDIDLEWKGSSNQRVIDVQKSKPGSVVIYKNKIQ